MNVLPLHKSLVCTLVESLGQGEVWHTHCHKWQVVDNSPFFHSCNYTLVYSYNRNQFEKYSITDKFKGCNDFTSIYWGFYCKSDCSCRCGTNAPIPIIGGGSNLLYGVWIFMKQHMRKRPCTQLVSKYTWHVIQMCTSSWEQNRSYWMQFVWSWQQILHNNWNLNHCWNLNKQLSDFAIKIRDKNKRCFDLSEIIFKLKQKIIIRFA